MSDEPIHMEVPLPHVRPVSPINPANAAEMARRKAAKEMAAREEKKARNRARAAALADSSASTAEDAANNRSLEKMTTEEMADKGTRKMLKIVLLGGEAFAPTSLREATEAASACANIAFKEAQKRKGTVKEDEAEDVDGIAATSVKVLGQLRRQIAAKQQAG